jgi:hypothetical protein
MPFPKLSRPPWPSESSCRNTHLVSRPKMTKRWGYHLLQQATSVLKQNRKARVSSRFARLSVCMLNFAWAKMVHTLMSSMRKLTSSFSLTHTRVMAHEGKTGGFINISHPDVEPDKIAPKIIDILCPSYWYPSSVGAVLLMLIVRPIDILRLLGRSYWCSLSVLLISFVCPSAILPKSK